MYIINACAIDISHRANIWSPNNTVLIENINYRWVVRYWVILNWRRQLTIHIYVQIVFDHFAAHATSAYMLNLDEQ